MGESTQEILATAAPAPLPRRRVRTNVLLFLATVASVLFTGALSQPGDGPFSLWAGVPFTVALLGILMTHEMAHYVFARLHNVDASLPYFIPMPLISPAGTMGAVIVMRSRIASKNALVDVGASGPIAGFVVAVGVLAFGLATSTPVPAEAAAAQSAGWLGLPATSGLHLIHELVLGLAGWIGGAPAPAPEAAPERMGMILADPLIVRMLQPLVATVGEGQTLSLSPVAFAGWFGMLVTALNLMPIGQLDGGHVAYAVFGARHTTLGRAWRWALVALGLFLYSGWLVWALVTRWIGTGHPPVDDEGGAMSLSRKIACWAALLIFVLTFMPAPIQ